MRRYRLIYLGRIPSNGSRKDKHRIRLALHRQLVNLWKSTSISVQAYPAEKHVGGFFFVPLVPERHLINPLVHHRVHLDVLLLKPRLRGVLSQGTKSCNFEAGFGMLSPTWYEFCSAGDQKVRRRFP
jgi:hypothetical protein